jgi:ElaB/YqjD/DUF883 family membrane-anchored ribosome-binding protein
MRPDDPRLIAADTQADAARTLLVETLQTARERLAPAALKKAAGDKIMDKALDGVNRARDHVRRNPLQIAAAAAILGAFLARTQIWALFRRLHVEMKNQMSSSRRD